MSTQSKDLVAEVLKCIEAVTSAAGGEKGRILGKFRARARSLPADLAAHGLRYLVVLTAARSNKSLIEESLKKNSCVEVVSSLMNMKDLDEDERSYALYGGVLVYLLKQQGIIGGGVTDFRSLLDKLADPAVEERAKIVTEWLKRLAEAYISE
ncbi:type III-B CRISPR module-associated protein Cmr5 [Infirmifilum sp.]|uniref:type III-B CRISPR module-associated protein Cmr5 n=1 Tax=Infirmifilum sp. TaxID=2856575 RepID=UPI003D0A3EFF